MSTMPTMNLASLQPSQIVCLESHSQALYGEVIQIIEPRQLCWMRPLLLAKFEPAGLSHSSVREVDQAQELWDVRLTADLAYPLPLFRPAFDTEVMPLISHLEDLDSPEKNVSNKKQLHAFLQQIWQENADVFKL